MKKSFILTLLMSFVLFCSCTNCKGNKEEQIEIDSTLNVTNIISMDCQEMYLMNPTYRWYESDILLENFLDEENDGTIEEIVNVFQTVTGGEKSFDTWVHKFQHFKDGTIYKDSIHGFWIEDYPLNNEAIKVSYDSAYALIQEVNLPKPHSRQVCLRKPIGPKDCNPQWIFGNVNEQIWIDAVTGEAKNSNPAFPDNFKYAFNW